MNIFYPLIHSHTCAYKGVKNVRSSKNLACFVFLKYPFWDSPFCLITDVFLKMLWLLELLIVRSRSFHCITADKKKFFLKRLCLVLKKQTFCVEASYRNQFEKVLGKFIFLKFVKNRQFSVPTMVLKGLQT